MQARNLAVISLLLSPNLIYYKTLGICPIALEIFHSLFILFFFLFGGGVGETGSYEVQATLGFTVQLNTLLLLTPKGWE